ASVIHCDLKPENVLLSRSPGAPMFEIRQRRFVDAGSNIHHTKIKLVDFGSA
ncbi:unnamed protein product, partial [Effrenium voratum]